MGLGGGGGAPTERDRQSDILRQIKMREKVERTQVT